MSKICIRKLNQGTLVTNELISLLTSVTMDKSVRLEKLIFDDFRGGLREPLNDTVLDKLANQTRSLQNLDVS